MSRCLSRSRQSTDWALAPTRKAWGTEYTGLQTPGRYSTHAHFWGCVSSASRLLQSTKAIAPLRHNSNIKVVMLQVSWCLGVSRRSGIACKRMPRQMLAALAGRQAELDQHGCQHGHQCRQRRRLCSLRKSYLSPWRPPSWSVTVTIVMAVVTIPIIALGPHTSSYTFPLACEQHWEASLSENGGYHTFHHYCLACGRKPIGKHIS